MPAGESPQRSRMASVNCGGLDRLLPVPCSGSRLFYANAYRNSSCIRSSSADPGHSFSYADRAAASSTTAEFVHIRRVLVDVQQPRDHRIRGLVVEVAVTLPRSVGS